MRRQSDQTAKAMNEQTRAIKDMTMGTQNISRQIGLITRANREHSNVSVSILNSLTNIRQVAQRNVQDVKDTQRASTGLLERSQNLKEIVERLSRNRHR
jgi:methyl-accepting chemotaxis protein